VTSFRLQTIGWIDVDGIAEYRFSYSFDNGQTFIPIETLNLRLPEISITFNAVFQT